MVTSVREELFFLTALAPRCGVWVSLVVAPWLNCYMATYILAPQSEIELASLDVEGRFLTTEPSGSPLSREIPREEHFE